MDKLPPVCTLTGLNPQTFVVQDDTPTNRAKINLIHHPNLFVLKTRKRHCDLT